MRRAISFKERHWERRMVSLTAALTSSRVRFFFVVSIILLSFKKFICDICRMQSYEEYLERQNLFCNFYQESLESNSLLDEKVKNRRKNLEDNEKIAIFAQ